MKDIELYIGFTNIFPLKNTSKSFSFSNIGASGTFLSDTFTLTSTKTVTVMVGHCSLGKSHVDFINNSDNSEVGTPFVVPEVAGTTIYYYQELPAGTYKFYVTPFTAMILISYYAIPFFVMMLYNKLSIFVLTP